MVKCSKILGKIFNRLTIVLILFAVQFAVIVGCLMYLGDYTKWTAVVFSVLSILMALFVIYRNSNPAYKIGWILLICLFPVLGATMYILCGNKRPSKKIQAKLLPVMKEHYKDLEQVDDIGALMGTRLGDTIKYISNKGPFPAWSDTKTKYYDCGDKAFVDIIQDLKKAKHYIFLEYFIIEEGYMWNTIEAILEEKVKEGVDVRLTYDDFGSMSKLSEEFHKRLRRKGIKVLIFNPIRPIVSVVYNNRDHRKILVIDGHTCYTGGYNLADEYINKVVRFGHWKDSGIRLEGMAVWNYTVMFLDMWNAFVPTEKDYSNFRPTVYADDVFNSDGILQPYSDSPLDDENIGENVYLEIINQAVDYVYIFTPYLILDNEMITCMQLAAKRGVDIRIVTPGIPDKPTVFRLTRSYYKPLIEAGVKIYEYSPGFIHAKSIIADDICGVVGTINFDYRSLFLHFECGTLMIGSKALVDLKQDCLDTFKISKEIVIDDCRTSFIGMLWDAFLRVISPLM